MSLTSLAGVAQTRFLGLRLVFCSGSLMLALSVVGASMFPTGPSFSLESTPPVLNRARPSPFLRSLHQAPPHRVPMDVFHRLHVLLHGPQSTIQEPPLPQLPRFTPTRVDRDHRADLHRLHHSRNRQGIRRIDEGVPVKAIGRVEFLPSLSYIVRRTANHFGRSLLIVSTCGERRKCQASNKNLCPLVRRT